MNKVIFFYVALGAVILIGSWTMVLAVKLDKAKAHIREMNERIARLVEPPF